MHLKVRPYKNYYFLKVKNYILFLTTINRKDFDRLNFRSKSILIISEGYHLIRN